MFLQISGFGCFPGESSPCPCKTFPRGSVGQTPNPEPRPINNIRPHEKTRTIAGVRFKAKWQVCRGKNDDFWMIRSCFGRHACATWNVFRSCFRHCVILGTSVLVVLPRRKPRFCVCWLVRQHVFTVFRIKWPFGISVEVWVCGAAVLPCLCSRWGGGALGQNGSFTEVER